MSPLEILLQQKSDQASQQALTDALRRKKEISMLSQMSGDPILSQFGQGYGADANAQASAYMQQQEKKAQRDLTRGYYDQLNQQFGANKDYQAKVLQETIRHNKASEGIQSQKAGYDTMKPLVTDVRRLSQDLSKANVPEVARGIELVNEALTKYEGKNIPGVGGMANLMPGLGEDAKHMKSLIGRIRNIILKARSGGAVTPQEADRLLEEFSLNPLGTDTSFRKAWADFQQVFGAGVNNIYAGYRPEVVDLYSQYQQQNAGGASTAPEQPSVGGAPVKKWGELD